MNKQIYSSLLFLYLCIPLRIFLIYLAKNKQKYLKVMAIFAIFIGCGFTYYYFSGTRTIGPETFGELIWWNDLRIVHAFNFFTFAFLCFFKPNIAYIPLVIDVIIGFISWLLYRFGN